MYDILYETNFQRCLYYDTFDPLLPSRHECTSHLSLSFHIISPSTTSRINLISTFFFLVNQSQQSRRKKRRIVQKRSKLDTIICIHFIRYLSLLFTNSSLFLTFIDRQVYSKNITIKGTWRKEDGKSILFD